MILKTNIPENANCDEITFTIASAGIGQVSRIIFFSLCVCLRYDECRKSINSNISTILNSYHDYIKMEKK